MDVTGRNARVTPWLSLLTVGVAALALHACGGGGVGSNGTGAAPEGVSVGTVTGFGSVIVDGVRFDDSNVVATREDQFAAGVPAELKLGQRVELGYRDQGADNRAAQSVSIEPAVVGPVSAVSESTLTVLGQIVEVNVDPSRGPVTVFETPSGTLADIAKDDWVEIHAVAEAGASASAPNWLATRIEKRDTPAVPADETVRVAGNVSEIDSSGLFPSFRLGALTVRTSGSTVRQPAGTALANGQGVVVYTTLSGFSAGVSPSLAARQLRIQARGGSQVDDYLAGRVSDLSQSASGPWSFEVAGVQVSYSGSAVTGLANGAYVLVQGRFTDSDSEAMTASRVQLRYAATQAEESAELHGTVIGWTAATRRFTVRDVTVDAAALKAGDSALDLDNCPSSGGDLADGFYVTVKGVSTTYGVRASRISCENDDSSNVSGEVVEFSGTASALQSGRFTLTPKRGSALTVRWSSSTYFRSPLQQDGANLATHVEAGRSFNVEGRLSGSANARVLQATKIKLKND